ncbi:hypothetical protein ACH42_06895 [Endozoicomonas sp. (ex Bugula neritina AB1)]|nr:hypothetical protein ACH42_06895 [Endozoicomonas sp. (ex Bugula neritina AB1)]
MNRDEFRFTCELPNGLHARPASYLVKRAQECRSDITLCNLRNHRETNAKSVLSLIAADVCYHDTCSIVIEGADAPVAFKTICRLAINELPACDGFIDDVVNSDWFPPSLRHLGLEACRGQITGEDWARGVPVCLKEHRFLLGSLDQIEQLIDIRDLCDQILRLSYGDGRLYSPDVLVSGSVCLANSLTPSQFLALDKRYLNGLVLQTGGKASHTVLLARAHGIPVVVGAKDAHELMVRSEEIIIDARLGLVITDPSEQVNRYYLQEERKRTFLNERCLPFIHYPGKTRDGRPIEVAGNIVGVDDAKQAFINGAEGIGLFRTEMLFMERSQAPDEGEQLAIYNSVINHAHGRPVVIRTIDVGVDKPVDYLNLGEEQNPFLGYRAIRLYPLDFKMLLGGK